MTLPDANTKTIAVIGLGYVGLPLAVEFGKIRPVIGFDVSAERIAELASFQDHTLEVASDEIKHARHLNFTSDPADLKAARIFIVTVPTPVDTANRPDLGILIKASETVGAALKQGDIVIYESTVYPGCTEEVCAPILEKTSGLKFNTDFFCGYSPERVNPGDKQHRLTSIQKVTSGSTPAIADEIDVLYKEIITAGTYKASSLKVAEAAKVIENTQRDLNIALMNELSLIFHKLDIDTIEVLQAAGTKWNFLPFRPGLVGGHCIGVDPYYLTHKAQEVGYHPEVILAGRRINDRMGDAIADRVVKLMLRKNIPVIDNDILVLGLTFKENCPDIRNTKVVDIVHALRGYNARVDIYDPWVSPAEAQREYGLECLDALPQDRRYAAIIVAVGHHQFVAMGEAGLKALGQAGAVLYDVKAILPLGAADGKTLVMKVLLTGAAGFIGMHTALRLLARGDTVIGVDNLNDYYDVSLKEARLARLAAHANFAFHKLDVADTAAMAELFAREKPQRVVHLAAQAGVRYSLTNPHAYIEANILGFTNILEGCRHGAVEHLVYASSSSVYGGNTALPFDEHQNIDHPVSLYAATKKANELMAHTYSHLFRLPTTGLRFFTVYGPWGRPDMALFLFAKAILEGRPIEVFNNGEMTRDFTYVDDIVEGVIRILDKAATPDPNFDPANPDPAVSNAPYRVFNIGNNRPTKLMDYIAALETSLGRTAQKIFLPMQPGDVPATAAQTDALDAWVGFKPDTPVETGVARFVAWYAEHYGAQAALGANAPAIPA